MRTKASAPIEVFHIGIRNVEHGNFDSVRNRGVFYHILRDLYLSTQDDKSFAMLAGAFMGEAHARIVGDLDVVHFTVERSTRGDRLDITAEEPHDELSFSIDYPELLLRKRDDWHTYFLDMAGRASERTTCCSGRKVGAVFVKDKVPMMSGFNGVPSGYPHPKVCARIEAGCKSGEGLDLCPCNHAERNAINLAAKHGVNLNGSILYCTTRPCFGCIGDLSVVGVSKVIYEQHYPHDITDAVAMHANIEMVHISEV